MKPYLTNRTHGSSEVVEEDSRSYFRSVKKKAAIKRSLKRADKIRQEKLYSDVFDVKYLF